MAHPPTTEPTNRNEIVELLGLYNECKAKELAAKQAADVLKAQIEELLEDCDLAHVAGMELARVQPGTTKTWDTTGLLRFCDTLRRTENADTAAAIMAFMKQGERAGYFRIAAIREARKD
jgi:hypothetical protein